MDRQNLTLLTDLYELTMMQGYFKNKVENKTVVFDAFFRNNPFGGGYSIMCGVEQLVRYIEDLHFSAQDIEYLRGLKIFDADFLDYLADFRFHGDIYCIPEGSLMFPREPMVKVVAPIMEAQLVETAILCIVNHRSWNSACAEHRGRMQEPTAQERLLSQGAPERQMFCAASCSVFRFWERTRTAGS